MWRTILAVVAGLVAWAVVATILNFGVRWGIDGYRAAEATLAFTLPMKIARLSLAAVASLAAGAVAGAIAPANRWAPAIVGVVTLVLFVPSHIHLWDKFPIWYHLTFLIPLLPLVMLGGLIGARKRFAAPNA